MRDRALKVVNVVARIIKQCGAFWAFVQCFALLVFLLRLPFYDDSYSSFFSFANEFTAFVVGALLVSMAVVTAGQGVLWLLAKWPYGEMLVEAAVRFGLAALIVLWIVSSCSGPSPPCKESRYITC